MRTWAVLFALGVCAAASPPAIGGAAFGPELADPRDLIAGETSLSTAVARIPGFPETLVFDMSWGLISVGEATLENNRVVDFAGRPAYEIRSTAFSNRFCDTFYKVRDLNFAWLDAERLDSLGYLKNLREGHFFRDEWVLFDAGSRRFLARTTGRDGNFSVKQGTIPASVQDILSSMYYIRTKELREGAEIVLDVNTKDNWPLVVKVGKKRSVKVPAGRFETFLLEPMLRREGIFIQKGKRLRIWVTADERKIPVLMKVEVFFGHVTAALSSIHSPPSRGVE
ncbi:MAG: DUF3108 domain-containing protein [Elusimicrobia bacterium]|nr:DUF3108 domain-containing protein [Elusimicrobiota bacterium]